MRDINELIGIFKCIDFDTTINEKEISRLETWINRNKNLVYSKEQEKLMRLISTALIDRVVTEEESRQILLYCDKFQNEYGNENSKLYELNGIIDGIICDGEVNEAEIYNLKQWIDDDKAFILNDKTAQELYHAIETILEDGVATKAEQKQLLELLSDRIRIQKFMNKLNSLKKTVKSKKNIGIDLIDLLDNEDAVQYIHSQAEKQLLIGLNSYSGMRMPDQEMLFISLILIAMLYYDGNYYKSVRNTYPTAYNRFSEQKVEGLIRTVISRYRLKKEETKASPRIINTVLSNAIVPSHYLKSFFDFIFDIYRLNFNYNLSNDLYNDFQFVYEGIRSNVRSSGDDLTLNVTKKTYKLIKSTKALIADPEQVEAVIKLSIIIVRLIDKKIWGKDLEIYNPYLKRGFEEWEKTFDAVSERAKKEKYVTKSRSRWVPRIILEGHTVYIVPPVHRVKAKYDYRTISIIIKNNGNILYQNDFPDIREIIGGYQVTNEKIPVNNPLGTLEYCLISGREQIYNSKDRLHRSFIVFDQDGGELKNNSDYQGSVIICEKNNGDEGHVFFEGNNYTLSSYVVHEGDTMLIENKVFNFSSLLKSGLVGSLHEKCFLRKSDQNETIPVYKNVSHLLFECNSDAEKILIVTDGGVQDIRNTRYTTSNRNGINRYCVEMDDMPNGIHTVEAYVMQNGKKEKILKSKIAIDANLSFKAKNMGRYSYEVRVTSAFLDYPVSKEINTKNYDTKWLKFTYKSENYVYLLPLNLGYYRISDGNWNSPGSDLWIGDISQDSLLEIDDLEIDQIKILSCDGGMLDETNLICQGVTQKARVGFLTSYKSSHDYVVLLLLKDGHVKTSIYCNNRCIIDTKKTELEYDPVKRELNIIPAYYGKGNVFVRIFDQNGAAVYQSHYLDNMESVRITKLNSFENYSIGFYEKEKGLSLKKERLLQKYEKKFYAWADFIGRSFKINEVTFDQMVRGEFLRKKHYFRNVFLVFTKMISQNFFEGKLYIKRQTGNYMLYNLNPVEIEICSDVIDDSVELSVTKNGDGLLLDFEHHGIMNAMDDGNAVDIFSYSMDINGEKKYE